MSREQEWYVDKMLSYTTEITKMIAGDESQLYTAESVKASIKRAIRIANELMEMESLPDKARETLAQNLNGLRSALSAVDEKLPTAKSDLDTGIYRKVINSGTLAGIDEAIIQNPNRHFPKRDIKTGEVIGHHYATMVAQPSGKNNVTLVWRSLPVSENDLVNKTVKDAKIMQEAVDLHLFVRSKYMEKPGRSLEFTIQEYMTARKLKATDRNRQYVATRITKACDMLKEIEMHVTSVGGWNGWGRLYTGSAYKNNIIRISMSDEMMLVFEAARRQHAWLPFDHMLEIDRERNPNTLPILLTLGHNKAMNWRKANHGDIIKMQYIISKIQKLAEYQQVITSFSEFKKYVIDPIERDMNISDKVYSWEYIKGGNTSIEDFVNAEIRVHWKEHPQDSKEFQDEIARQTMLSLQKSGTRKAKSKRSAPKTTRTARVRK